MNFGLDTEDIKLINAVFAAHPAVQEVIIFGSRAMGNYKPGSDIDLVVKGENVKHKDILDICLGLDALDTLYTFDLQRFDGIKDPDVLDHIKRVGKQFYKKK